MQLETQSSRRTVIKNFYWISIQCEDHVWFEDRWMVASWYDDNVVWTDSWLSIAGAGCDFTGVGAGEEQVGLVRGTRCGKGK
jgi:hypothetical protein